MSTSIKKTVILTLTGVGLVILGAVSSWGVGKALTPTTTPAVTVSAPAAPAAVAPTATVAPAAPVAAPQATVAAASPAVAPSVVAPAAPAGPILAEVIDVKPHYVTKTVPVRRCQQVPRTVVVPGQGPSGVGAVLGGVAGGVAGNQIGGGRGKVAATIGGAILGAAVGNQVERNMHGPQTRVVYETVCSTSYVKKTVRSGYEVTYVYNGQQGTTIMKKRPLGKTIPLTLKPD